MTVRTSRRPGGASVSVAYESFYGCERKIRYADEAEAVIACDWAETPESRPEPYACDKCGAWHIGRSRALARAKEKRRRALITPRTPPARRLDPTLFAAIGERAYGGGKIENVGSRAKRQAVVVQRAAAAEKIARRHR